MVRVRVKPMSGHAGTEHYKQPKSIVSNFILSLRHIMFWPICVKFVADLQGSCVLSVARYIQPAPQNELPSRPTAEWLMLS